MSETRGTTSVWPNYSAQNVQMAARKPVKQMGKDEFLQILVTQLRNQDPMQPMQDKEFIAQMAQFSSLEQMMNVATQMSGLRQSAGLVAGLIGKQVGWMETTETGVVDQSGIVDSIVRRDGLQYVKVGAKEIKVDDLTWISEAATKPANSGDAGGTGA
ncbi:flagellar hook capping protein [Cohnella pontilimi]|uniref:Flagellar hook capping protein n=1 Tax=Cohnella pontilimi TaxID=2564100 RepID=A0A4U0FE92_9BACL|nr:flagellar hook capping FlgD N-terminal domain-containing protein [Cohnella pontilimi]TJY43185.1 flagellar hook capping protein [Cohnella pontilimi]